MYNVINCKTGFFPLTKIICMAAIKCLPVLYCGADCIFSGHFRSSSSFRVILKIVFCLLFFRENKT